MKTGETSELQDTCEHCAFRVREVVKGDPRATPGDQVFSYTCRAVPPTPVLTKKHGWLRVFPIVRADDWCGMFKLGIILP